MKRIYLNRDRRAFALVDDEDFEKLSQYHWMLKSDGYAYRQKCKGKKVIENMLMHHQILGKPFKGNVVDHINHNELDNRRSNLRFATYTENNLNRRGLQSNNTSGHAGVRKHSYITKNGEEYWQADVKRNGKNTYLGYFKDLQSAVNARNEFLAQVS